MDKDDSNGSSVDGFVAVESETIEVDETGNGPDEAPPSEHPDPLVETAGPEGEGMRRGPGAGQAWGRLAALGRGAGVVLLGLVSILLPAYFLTASSPGRAMITGLMEDEIHGTALLEGVVLDPVGGSASVTGLVVKDRQDRPVMEIDALHAVASSVVDNAYDKVLLRGGRLLVEVDEQGQVNWANLVKDTPSTGKPSPTVFRVDHISVADTTVTVQTPFADLELGPVSASGSAAVAAGGPPAGRGTARIEHFALSPRHEEVAAILTAVVGDAGPYRFGPLEGKSRLDGNLIKLESFHLQFPLAEVNFRGEIDHKELIGELFMNLVTQGEEIASFGIRVQPEDWFLSVLISSLELPEMPAPGIHVPGFELNHFSFNVVPRQFTVGLNRLMVDRLTVADYGLHRASVSGRVHFEADDRLDVIADKLGSLEAPWGQLEYLLGHWQKGEVNLSLLVESIVRQRELLVEPLRLKVEVNPGKDGRVEATVRFTPHPHGSVEVDLAVDPVDESGHRPWAGEVRVNDLYLPPLLGLAGVSGMLKTMLAGKLNGKIRFRAARLGTPLVQVDDCRFELKGGATPLVFLCPKEQQEWDFDAKINASFFKKEVTFGEGRLLIRTPDELKSDGQLR